MSQYFDHSKLSNEPIKIQPIKPRNVRITVQADAKFRERQTNEEIKHALQQIYSNWTNVKITVTDL